MTYKKLTDQTSTIFSSLLTDKLLCKFCKRECKSIKVLASHQSKCKINPTGNRGNNIPIASCILCKKEMMYTAIDRHNYNIHQTIYPRKRSTTAKCKQCNVDLPSNKMFCSSSCAAIFNNRERIKSGYTMSQEQKDKISKSARKFAEKNKKQFDRDLGEGIDMDTQSVFTRIGFCATCGIVYPKSKGRRGQTCSSECLHDLRSRKARNNPGLCTRRSKDEITLFNICQSVYPNTHSNLKIYDGWDADIVIPDYQIAILWNGPWHYKEMNIGNHSLSQVQTRDRIKTKEFQNLGWTVLTFEDRYYTPETAFVEIQKVISGVPTRIRTEDGS